MLHVKLNGNEAENTMQVNILNFYTPTAPQISYKVKNNFFSEVGHDAYYIKLKGKKNIMQDLMQTPDRSDIEIVQISIF